MAIKILAIFFFFLIIFPRFFFSYFKTHTHSTYTQMCWSFSFRSLPRQKDSVSVGRPFRRIKHFETDSKSLPRSSTKKKNKLGTNQKRRENSKSHTNQRNGYTAVEKLKTNCPKKQQETTIFVLVNFASAKQSHFTLTGYLSWWSLFSGRHRRTHSDGLVVV